MNIRCIIVDDEPLSRKVVEKYISSLPQLELVAQCKNAFDALDVLRKDSIDLIFLDINMPKLSGISLMKSLAHPPLVIFTTAYPEHAVEGFELEAVDYLVKPFSLERFIKAVDRAGNRLMVNGQSPESNFLLIKADKKLFKIDFESIYYLQAYGDYVKIFTAEKTFLTKEKLFALEEKLPAGLFLRVHRSYIISIQAIQFVEGNQVKILEELIPVSASYKETLLARLEKNI